MSVHYDNVCDAFRDLLDSFTDCEHITVLFNEVLPAVDPKSSPYLRLKGVVSQAKHSYFSIYASVSALD